MNREQAARRTHRSGTSCAYAVYSAFSDIASGSAPAPRSEGGKCGAVLSAEKVLRQNGIDISDFDQAFLAQFGSLKCSDLLSSKGHSCNDLVGVAARLVEERTSA